jgi:hypothetical protein
MKKDSKPMAVVASFKNIPASQIGKMVADHGMKKNDMCDKMAAVRSVKGKK